MLHSRDDPVDIVFLLVFVYPVDKYPDSIETSKIELARFIEYGNLSTGILSIYLENCLHELVCGLQLLSRNSRSSSRKEYSLLDTFPVTCFFVIFCFRETARSCHKYIYFYEFAATCYSEILSNSCVYYRALLSVLILLFLQ